MAFIKKNYPPVVALSVLVFLVGSWWWRSTNVSAALLQGPPYTAMAPETHSAVHRLLDRLSLDRDALVALNLTAMQAESMLGAVRNWYETNSATLDIRQAAIDAKVLEVRRLKKAIAQGPFLAGRDASLAQARQGMADARGSYETTLDPLRAGVNAQLSASQKTAWSAIATGHGQSMPLRMLSLTDAQRVSLSRAKRHGKWQRNAASTSQERSTARSNRESAVDTALTAGQKTIVGAYETNYGSASAVVADAYALVMPLEEG